MMASLARVLEKGFEALLWKSRLVVLVAVLFSLAASLVMFYIATVDAVVMIAHIAEYASPDIGMVERAAMRAEAVTHVVEIVDGYLLGSVLLIFSLGLYELFISKIDEAGGEAASKVLLIQNLDDLKNRLAKVILMILIVRYFESALGIHFDSWQGLLTLAGGIALIGLALYLSHMGEKPH